MIDQNQKDQIERIQMKTYTITAQINAADHRASVEVQANNFKDAWNLGETIIRMTHKVCIVTGVNLTAGGAS